MWVLCPLFHVCAQPGNEFIESEPVGLVKVGHKKVGLFGVRREVQAVDGKKSIGGGESRPLVAIHKGMILRAQALPERRGFPVPLQSPRVHWSGSAQEQDRVALSLPSPTTAVTNPSNHVKIPPWFITSIS